MFPHLSSLICVVFVLVSLSASASLIGSSSDNEMVREYNRVVIMIVIYLLLVINHIFIASWHYQSITQSHIHPCTHVLQSCGGSAGRCLRSGADINNIGEVEERSIGLEAAAKTPAKTTKPSAKITVKPAGQPKSPVAPLLPPKGTVTPLLPPAIAPLAPPFPGIMLMESESIERGLGNSPAKNSPKTSVSVSPTMSPTSSSTAAVSHVTSATSGTIGNIQAVGPRGPAGPSGPQGTVYLNIT